MTEKRNATGSPEKNPSTFGGILYPSDFSTVNRSDNQASGSPIARRILRDWRFDRQCAADRENHRKRNTEKEHTGKENDEKEDT